jgi:hypothetical protein
LRAANVIICCHFAVPASVLRQGEIYNNYNDLKLFPYFELRPKSFDFL